MRLQKIIAAAGIASRRGAEEIIKRGDVKVNGEVITEMGVQIDPQKDEVAVYDKIIQMPDEFIYLMLNKPIGYLTTANDPYKRKTVFDLLPKQYQSIFPVGRLDKDSEGLLLFTNDGDLSQKLTHPKFSHQKEYKVRVDKKIIRDFIAQLKQGIVLDEGIAKVDSIEKLGPKEFKLTLHQGWKRQIRRMIEKLDFEVEFLQRIRLADYYIENLEGKLYKIVKKDEII
jgi:23S rRNA pseudouridine2605 synthase